MKSGELIAAGLALPLKPTSRRRDIAPELWPRLEFSARFEEAFGERRLRFVDVFIREKEPAGAVAQEDRASKSRPRAARRRPGRPSIMKEIGEEMKRRAAFGELEPSLRREAEALAEWAQERFPEAHVPKPGSIERSHGKFYRELKAVNRDGK